MNVLTQTWRQLVRRRLWPVALLLVGALVAVPVVLAKPAAPAPAHPLATTAAAPASTPDESLVQLASNEEPAKRRRVLGVRKDPFEPAPLPKVKHRKRPKTVATAEATATATVSPVKPSGSVPMTGGSVGATGGAVPAPPAPVPTATPAPVKRFPAHSVEVSFGKTDGDMKKSTLTRLETLPSSSSPLLVFMGFHKGGKVAEFMVTGDVTAEGDGTCDPHPQSCQTLLLHNDETEFLTFSGTTHDGEYELDLDALHPGKATTATAAKASAKP